MKRDLTYLVHFTGLFYLDQPLEDPPPPPPPRKAARHGMMSQLYPELWPRPLSVSADSTRENPKER